LVADNEKEKDNLTAKNIFDFDSFTFKINKMILFKLSKSNPYLAGCWQYFLILCNFQDSEYWQLSTEKSSKLCALSRGGQQNLNEDEIDSISEQLNQNDLDYNSSSSSNNNSLNPEIQQGFDAKQKKKNSTKNGKNNKLQTLKINSSEFNSSGQPLVLSAKHIEHATLNEQLFRYLSMTIYCDYIATRNQLDNTVGLTMILVNNLVELFELSAYEPNICDLFSTIHR